MTQEVFGGLFQSFIMLFVLLLLYIVLRRERLAAIVLWLIMTVALSLTNETVISVPFAALTGFLVVWVLYRYGFLALISSLLFMHLMIFYPITSEFSAWYAGDYVLGLIVLLALLVFAFYTSLAGQPLLRASLPDD